MGLSTGIKANRGVRHLKARLRRRRALRHLNRDLADHSDRTLADLLTKTGLSRGDLFTGFKGNRGHRALMGQMLRHFGIDRETACVHHWRKLVQADKACARCANAEKCRRWLAWGRKNDAPQVFCRNAGLFTELRLDLARLTRTPRTFAYEAGATLSEAEAVGSAWRRQRRSEARPYWRRRTGGAS